MMSPPDILSLPLSVLNVLTLQPHLVANKVDSTMVKFRHKDHVVSFRRFPDDTWFPMNLPLNSGLHPSWHFLLLKTLPTSAKVF